ncbi:MAG: glycosyltransferase [Leclercia sp.]
MEEKLIVVNASALATSGALTILRQFLASAITKKQSKFICFVPDLVDLPDSDNVLLIRKKKKNWFKRIYWDSFELPRIIKKHYSHCSKVVSLQNTSINTPIHQVIYLHQPIPFCDINFLKKSNFSLKFFLYKKFYSFFIFMFVNNNTNFVVQTRWMKDSLCKRGIKAGNIDILRPNFLMPAKDNSETLVVDAKGCPGVKTTIFLYPATPINYKNHQIILQAINKLVSKSFNDFVFQVTFEKNTYKIFDSYVKSHNLEEYISYLGVVSYDELIKRYKECNVLLFPSYLETFGLPLLEASTLGCDILTSDLPYSRDVLSHYEFAKFLPYDDEIAWALNMQQFLGKNKIKHIQTNNPKNENNSWDVFLSILER